MRLLINKLKLNVLFLFCGVVILAGCNVKDVNPKEEEKHITEKMDEAISEYIIQNKTTSFAHTEKQFEVHKIYGTSESNGILSIYMWSYMGGFNKSTGTEVQAGQSVPAVIRLSEKNGKYTVIEYEEPLDGSMWLPSLEEMFPKKYLKLAQKDSENIEDLQKEMDRKVTDWLDMQE